MVFVDIPKVRGKMAERGFNITSMSKNLGISRETFANYLKEPGKIPYTVLASMADMLCDTQDEAAKIFFAQ